MKEKLLEEISLLLKADEKEDKISLEVMEFLSEEELTNIKNSLLKRKENRKKEQEDWYNEWAEKFKK